MLQYANVGQGGSGAPLYEGAAVVMGSTNPTQPASITTTGPDRLGIMVAGWTDSGFVNNLTLGGYTRGSTSAVVRWRMI